VKWGKEASYTCFSIMFDGLDAGNNVISHVMSKESR
jgi:hypothetical protein